MSHRDTTPRFLVWCPTSEDWTRKEARAGQPLVNMTEVPKSSFRPEVFITKFHEDHRSNPFIGYINRTKTSEVMEEGYGRALVWREEDDVIASPMLYLEVTSEFQIKVGLQLALGWASHDIAMCNHPEIAFQLFKNLVASLLDVESKLDMEHFYERFISSLDSWAD